MLHHGIGAARAGHAVWMLVRQFCAAGAKTVAERVSAPKSDVPLSPRMLVDIPTREDCVDEYFLGLDSEQDSQVANPHFSFGSPVNEMVGSFHGVLLSIAQRFSNAPFGIGVQAPEVACSLPAELNRVNWIAQKSSSMTSNSPRSI